MQTLLLHIVPCKSCDGKAHVTYTFSRHARRSWFPANSGLTPISLKGNRHILDYEFLFF